MDLADDTPLVVIPPEAYEKADAMRALLAADLDDESIARLVWDFDYGDMELQLATWSLLNWREQESWRNFRQLWHTSRKIRA